MTDHRKRFERWRKKLPKHTAYLVEQVLARVVPEFEAKGFVWYPDYAGDNPTQIGANEIPLQRRRGKEWPTVQIQFDKRRPWFAINFTSLTPSCNRLTDKGYVDIPREQAVIVDGPAVFRLCKGKKHGLDCEFGYTLLGLVPGFSLFARYYLNGDIKATLGLLPILFDIFDRGIPADWFLAGSAKKVSPHVMLIWLPRLQAKNTQQSSTYRM